MRKSLRSLIALTITLGLISAVVALQGSTAKTDAERLPVLAQASPRYWKGNLHTHSLWSDGDDFPEMIADWYKRNGYDFLCLSDHNVLSEGQRWIDVTKPRESVVEKYLKRFGPNWVEFREPKKDVKQVRLKPLAEFRNMLEVPGRFLLVPGEEITHKYGKYPVHINGINLRDVIQPIDGKDVTETIRVNLRQVDAQAKKLGWANLAFLNHPNYKWGVSVQDMLGAEELRFFEVFNGHPGVANYGDERHPSCELMWDVLLASRLQKAGMPMVYGMGTDDAHNYHKMGPTLANPGRGWIMVKAPFLSAESLVRAMLQGDFYMSSGVTLKNIERGDNQIKLTIEGQESVTYKTEFIASMRGASVVAKERIEEGKESLGPIRTYSDEIGTVVGVSESQTPSYTFTGKELYVRARVASSRPHPNPFKKGDVEMAWTQPLTP